MMKDDFRKVRNLLERVMMEISTSDEVTYSVIGATSSEPAFRQVESKAFLPGKKV